VAEVEVEPMVTWVVVQEPEEVLVVVAVGVFQVMRPAEQEHLDKVIMEATRPLLVLVEVAVQWQLVLLEHLTLVAVEG
jgi:hypothetical protein